MAPMRTILITPPFTRTMGPNHPLLATTGETWTGMSRHPFSAGRILRRGPAVKILVIGGTRFAGRHFVGLAAGAGHDLTLFNRGVSGPTVLEAVEQVHGDRDGGLDRLRGRAFNAVVDMCGYFPRVVRQSVELLAGAAERYLFVSSISVYADGIAAGFDESAPVRTVEDPSAEEITGESYGGLKALCEREVERGFPGRVLIVRPGLIVGPLDRTDRFTYWVRRVARGGDVLAPGSPDRQVQFIDARDLAGWMLRMVEGGGTGVYNATGPQYRLTMGGVLETCRATSGSDATFEWVEEAFLLAEGVAPWSEFPLWIPESEPDMTLECDVRKAIAKGLTFRPLAETIADTLAWDRTRPVDTPMEAGMDPARERELLAKWRGRL